MLADPQTGELATPTFEWEAGVHPAADLFPMMDPISFAKLADDIACNGLIEPIWLDTDGLLLDGRNRLAACQAAKLEPATRTYTGDDAVGFVLSLNVNRRHLTVGQLAMVASDSIPLYAVQAKERMREAGRRYGAGRPPKEVETDLAQPLSGRSAELAAAAVGVGAASVKKAQRVQREDPELADRVRSGEVTVDAAHKKVKRNVTTAFKGPMEKLAAETAKANASPDRREIFETMAAKGHTSSQIADELGIGRETLRTWRLKNGVDAPPADAVVANSRLIDANRVMAATVAGAEPSGTTEHIDYSKLDRSLLEGWASSLTQSISSLTTIRNNLRKELSQ